MHFEKPSKEKPCTQPTVKKLLEEKRKRETSSVPPSCSHSSIAPPTYKHLSSGEPTNCPGASGVYSEMAVSSQMWPPTEEFLFSYHSQPGASYTSTFNVPVTSEYGALSHLQSSGSIQPQPYQESLVTGPDPSFSAPWPIQSTQLTFGPPLDSSKLQEAQILISGMDYSRITEQDEDGDTILHIYAAKGLRELAYVAAERLRSMGSLDVKEHKGKTALLVAVTANKPEIVDDLLTLGADINACDVNGQTALHLAAHYGYGVVLQVLLSRVPPPNHEARNFEGMTPLHCAALAHCTTMKRTYTAAPSDGSPPTSAMEMLACVQLLLREGSSLLSQEIKSNKTVLHLAVKEGNIELVRFLLRIPQTNMKVFVDLKQFVNMKAHGHTALHMAAGLHGNPHQREMLQLLLSRGADPSIRSLENDQAAHLLQSGPVGEQLKTLLKRRSTSSRRRVLSWQDQE